MRRHESTGGARAKGEIRAAALAGRGDSGLVRDSMMKPLLSLALAATCLVTAGCETTGQTALLGAGVGAGLAAVTGHDALRGAAIGAASGAVVGHVAKRQREEAYAEGYYEGRQASYPLGRRTENRGFVVSPYSPHHVIDVRGIPRGAKVQDPSNGRIFINP